jgi:hypothetical protein
MRFRASTAVALLALAACILAAGFSAASFTDTTSNPQTVSSEADFLAPSATSAIAKSQGGVAGYVKAGGGYYVYANVAESGNPASGIASVKADVSAITSRQTAATLSAGSYSVGGSSYNYRSAELKVNGGLSAGPMAYALVLTDNAGNSRTQSFSVTVDNGPLAGSDFDTANTSGGTSGKAEKGDTISYAFNKPPDPGSIVSGWDGSGSKSVTVSIADNSSNDTLTVSGATLGSVALQGNYTNTGKTSIFSGSTLTLSGSVVTIVLGSEPSGNARTETTKPAPEWTPSTALYDAAGNACSNSKVTGENVRQF